MMRIPPKSPRSYGKRSPGHTMNMKLRGTPNLVDTWATTEGVKLPCTNTKSITICAVKISQVMYECDGCVYTDTYMNMCIYI